ncbi:MAG: TIGR00725 family protein, partial [Candidatus Dormibacteria bacterium]
MGELMAEGGAVLLCGGLGGAMEAAAEGASRAGGLTVGLLPGDDPRAASPWIRVPIATGLGEGRNLLLVRAAQAVIAVGGALGTLTEIALALRLGRPVAGLATWQL